MGKGKQFKIAQTKEMSNILEFPRELKGKWSEHFGNNNPIVLELACGKGHYTLALAKKYPGLNVIGIDIKGPRLWAGGKIGLEEELSNARFVRGMIDHLDEFFAESEVDEIWITFPDPQPKKERKRLTHPVFINKYKTVLKPGGRMHLKTDNTLFFEFTLGVLAGLGLHTELQTRNLYHSELYEDDILQVKTYYETLWVNQGSTIKYCTFKLN